MRCGPWSPFSESHSCYTNHYMTFNAKSLQKISSAGRPSTTSVCSTETGIIHTCNKSHVLLVYLWPNTNSWLTAEGNCCIMHKIHIIRAKKGAPIHHQCVAADWSEIPGQMSASQSSTAKCWFLNGSQHDTFDEFYCSTEVTFFKSHFDLNNMLISWHHLTPPHNMFWYSQIQYITCSTNKSIRGFCWWCRGSVGWQITQSTSINSTLSESNNDFIFSHHGGVSVFCIGSDGDFPWRSTILSGKETMWLVVWHGGCMRPNLIWRETRRRRRRSCLCVL